MLTSNVQLVGWLCWGLTSQSTIFQSCRDGAIASWVINQYFRGVKCLAQGHNTAAVGLEPRTSRSGVWHSTTEPPRSPNVQLGYILTRGGGQAVQSGLSCPPPRISERMDNMHILLHHLLQEYLIERDTNFISVNLRCLLQMFSWVTYWQGVGGKLSRAVILPPAQNFKENG